MSVVVITLLHAASSFAAAVNAASCSQADVQAAINAATDNTVVNIPAGTCDWPSTVTWTNKNIYVKGAGIDQTVITRSGDYVFQIAEDDSTKGQFRLSDMTLSGATTHAVIGMSSETNSGIVSGWRIDHIKFNYPANLRTGIEIRGDTYGVIDHNVFLWAQGAAVLIAAFNASDTWCSATNPLGNYLNSQPLDLGTANAVYMEDNVYTSTGFSAINVYDTSSGGGRAVFRHNTVTGGFYYSHWTRTCEIGGIVHEIYNNVWVGNSDYNAYPVRLEAGTGVIFNNTIQSYTGYNPPIVVLDDRRAIGGGETSSPMNGCDGNQPWDGNLGDAAAPGWPCLGQIGRSPGKSVAQIMAGDKQVSSPLYLWNNGTESGCSSGGTCTNVLGVSAAPANYVTSVPHPNGDVDYVNNGTSKPGYAPFVYPHPLVTGSAQPAPPTNLKVISIF
jgi:hypothetical protein